MWLLWVTLARAHATVLDSDADGVPDALEDRNGNGDPTDDDTDADGTPDYLDPDDDGDGVPTADEEFPGSVTYDGNPTNDDFDQDGLPDYLDPDDDNDGVPTLEETAAASDHYNVDSDYDSVPDGTEWGGGTTPQDTDQDGIPDVLDSDDDNDGIDTVDEGSGDSTSLPVGQVCEPLPDGVPDYLDGGNSAPAGCHRTGVDTSGDFDGDGIPNFLDCDTVVCTLDTDADGLPDAYEQLFGSNPNNPDTDGDGKPDGQEAGSWGEPDTDRDGVPDLLDPTDDPVTTTGTETGLFTDLDTDTPTGTDTTTIDVTNYPDTAPDTDGATKGCGGHGAASGLLLGLAGLATRRRR